MDEDEMYVKDKGNDKEMEEDENKHADEGGQPTRGSSQDEDEY